jgi:endonuclease III
LKGDRGLTENDIDDRLERMLRGILSAQEDDADCNECFEELDKFVEMVQAGTDPAEILPRVEAHLKCCSDCHEEYEALLAILNSEGHDT